MIVTPRVMVIDAGATDLGAVEKGHLYVLPKPSNVQKRVGRVLRVAPSAVAERTTWRLAGPACAPFAGTTLPRRLSAANRAAADPRPPMLLGDGVTAINVSRTASSPAARHPAAPTGQELLHKPTSRIHPVAVGAVGRRRVPRSAARFSKRVSRRFPPRPIVARPTSVHGAVQDARRRHRGRQCRNDYPNAYVPAALEKRRPRCPWRPTPRGQRALMAPSPSWASAPAVPTAALTGAHNYPEEHYRQERGRCGHSARGAEPFVTSVAGRLPFRGGGMRTSRRAHPDKGPHDPSRPS